MAAAKPTRRRAGGSRHNPPRPFGTQDSMASTGPHVQVDASRRRAGRLVRGHRWPALEVDRTRHHDIRSQAHRQSAHAEGSVGVGGLVGLTRSYISNPVERPRSVLAPHARATAHTRIRSATRRPGLRSNPIQPEARASRPRHDGLSEPVWAQLRASRSQPWCRPHLTTSEIAFRVVSRTCLSLGHAGDARLVAGVRRTRIETCEETP